LDTKTLQYAANVSVNDPFHGQLQNGVYWLSASSQYFFDGFDGQGNLVHAFKYDEWPTKNDAATVPVWLVPYPGPYPAPSGKYTGDKVTIVENDPEVLLGEYIQVRLPVQAYVDAVTFANYGDSSCTKPRVVVSSDGKTWKLVYSSEDAALPSDTVKVGYFDVVDMLYGRLICSQTGGNQFGFWATSNFQFLSSLAAAQKHSARV
jgi:hypothetical protein